MSKITLISADDKTFEVDSEVAFKSVLIKNMCSDIGSEKAEIPLQAKSEVLKKVIEFCEYHRKDPEPEAAPENNDRSDRIKRTTDISEWDYRFMNLENEMIFEIMLLANYLDIRSLFDLTCKTVANMIKGKSPEQIRLTLNIENDFTPEQLEEIKRENEWAEDP